MRRAHELARTMLIALLGALAVAGGISLAIWQAPVIRADILADN